MSSTALDEKNEYRTNSAIYRSSTLLDSGSTTIKNPKTFTIRSENSIYWLNEGTATNSATTLSEDDEDHMAVLTGKDAQNMLELLKEKSKKIDYEILKDGVFTENSVSFELDITYKSE